MNVLQPWNVVFLIGFLAYLGIRHPMYAAIWLWSIGQGLVLQNWLAGWAALPSFAALYAVRTPREEAMMIACFGEEYRAYMRRSGRVLPPVRRRTGA